MGVESPQGMPCNHAPFGAVDHGGVRLGCGFRQPNSEMKFGASAKVTPPYGCIAGGAQQAGIPKAYRPLPGQVSSAEAAMWPGG